MPAQPVVVIGGGGMGRCVLDLIDLIPDLEAVGVLDDGHPDEDLLSARRVPFLGPIEKLETMPADVGYVIGIGSTGAKRAIDARLVETGRVSPVVVHPNVHMGFDVQLGPGAVICSHVSMENHIRLGRHVHVNQNSTIGHDGVLGDYCTVSPLAAVSGNVTTEAAVFVGTGASVRQGLTLRRGSTVGMGAAVLSDVAPGVTVVGVPAVPMCRDA